MKLLPLRLQPGADLRRALEQLATAQFPQGAFVAAGIGSLTQARLRYADENREAELAGPFEILTLSGTLTREGAHLHMSISDAQGRVLGGHVAHGSVVRTTAELLVVPVDGWALAREADPSTGFKELRVRPAVPGAGGGGA